MADPSESLTSRTFEGRVLHTEDFPDEETEQRTRVVWVCPEDADIALPVHQAGQYAMLTFPGFLPRPYSIGNAPNGKFYEFHIKRGGSGASRYGAEHLKAGDVFEVSSPFGSCVYLPPLPGDLVAVAGGVGLSQMKAVVEAALEDRVVHNVFLYHGVRTLDDLYLEDFFLEREEEDKRFRYIPVLSDERIEGIRHGLVGQEMIKDFTNLQDHRIYAAGPVELVRHVRELCLAAGARPARIHSDLDETETPGNGTG